MKTILLAFSLFPFFAVWILLVRAVTRHILMVIMNHQIGSLKGLMFGTTLLKLKQMVRKCVNVKLVGNSLFLEGQVYISHLNQHITKCPLIMKSRDSVTQMTIKSYIPFQFEVCTECVKLSVETIFSMR